MIYSSDRDVYVILPLLFIGLFLLGCDQSDNVQAGGGADVSQSTSGSAADAPRSALAAMATAMRQGDSSAFSELVYTGGSEEAAAFAEMMAALVELYGASHERYGKMLDHAYLTIPTHAQIKAMRFTVDGDTAVGTLEGGEPTMLCKIDGQWMLDFRHAVRRGPEAVAPRTFMRLAENARAIAGEIREGGFTTEQEADQALAARNRKVLEEAGIKEAGKADSD